ncbi:uncharacterized protein TRIADDRAFT_57249 [Trichoplax adhaerens]|uniref:Guanylyl cyclase n=1 Tax=Trichoplax adhaerens TaxID=10228 RepID=B3RYX5_TRIAD|nr:hypothetical protein TRIADDRAFT_57249 [Trichoplax adhaerens]EDV24101.1 hypothetical protein TRIADDRAFT_57249 [Trichoplax adhaerens]|eukprot:XP_002113627.1 hypothetical protein TRIADDRAFT_57249 [Trichoplax adhaerens]
MDDSDYIIQMHHIRQRHDWDCGIASSKMALRIWTIDLSYLFQKYDVRSTFFTTTLGADPNYNTMNYYNDQFEADKIRINKLFKLAPSHGIQIIKRTVSIDEIIDHIAKNNVAIVLINAYIVRCLDRSDIKAKMKKKMFSTISDKILSLRIFSNKFLGHFVVVCGFNRREKIIYYKDPGSDCDICAALLVNFDAARHSYGTDDDILFIYKDN